MTTQLRVRSAAREYPVVIGPGLLHEVGERLRRADVAVGENVFIVTDETVSSLGYADQVAACCEQAGYHTAKSVVRPRDESKSLATAARLYNELLDAGVRRSGVVLALGGGVVGDLAGFVAATYLRGVRFAQLPTTLLAHDSSIGGKVGINLPRAKNLVGAFYPPIAVWYDVDTLASLPVREWRGGMAEVIKHGLIADSALFEQLQANPVAQYPGARAAEALVARAAAVKVQVVEADEREAGRRMWLNLGHTVGHAVEHVSHYEFNHGEAIAIGLCVEAEIAVGRTLIDSTTRDQINSVIGRHGLPTTVPPYPFAKIVGALNLDKKHTGGSWTFVLPTGIGHVDIVRGVSESELWDAWTRCSQQGGERI